MASSHWIDLMELFCHGTFYPHSRSASSNRLPNLKALLNYHLKETVWPSRCRRKVLAEQLPLAKSGTVSVHQVSGVAHCFVPPFQSQKTGTYSEW